MERRHTIMRDVRTVVRYLLLGFGLLGVGLATLDAVRLGAKRGQVLHEFEALSANAYYHVLAAPLRVRPGMDARSTAVASRLGLRFASPCGFSLRRGGNRKKKEPGEIPKKRKGLGIS